MADQPLKFLYSNCTCNTLELCLTSDVSQLLFPVKGARLEFSFLNLSTSHLSHFQVFATRLTEMRAV